MRNGLLNDIGFIGNKEACLSILKSRVSGLPTKEKQLVELVNSSYKTPFYYFSDFYEVLEESDFKVNFMWVDSGFKDKRSGEPIFFQFFNDGIGWQGATVGTVKDIVNFQESRDKIDYSIQLPTILNSISRETTLESGKINISDKEVQESKQIKENIEYAEVNELDVDDCTIKARNSLDCADSKEFYQELFDRLLVQNGWDLNTSRLRFYIDAITNRINHKISKNEDVSRYIIFNKSKSKVIFNSGLLDKFGKTIMLKTEYWSSAEKPNGVLSYVRLSVVNSKSDLIKDGFEKEKIKGYKVERVPFYNNKCSELIFSADIDDFDLDNWERLSHCISERRDRFPEEIKNSSPEVLCQDVIAAIKLGVELSKYDFNYVKPTYSIKDDIISFIIPYHVNNNFQKKPELGIVVSKFESTDLWQVMTILDYDTCCHNIKALNIYTKESFV